MRGLVKTILIAILTYVLGPLFPFWIITISSLVVNLFIKTKAAGAFFSGFFGAGTAWWIAAFTIHNKTDGILSDRMAALFNLNVTLLIIVTAVIAGLLGGFGGLLGNVLRPTRKMDDNIYRG